MRVDQFDFELPEARIALAPVEPRDAARMLHVRNGACTDRHVQDLQNILRDGDLLVVNDTKVIPAQLKAHRAARGEGDPVLIDITLHKDVSDNTHVRWRAFARPAKRLSVGDIVSFGSGDLTATVTMRDGAEAEFLFDVAPDRFFPILSQIGEPPLPPYIGRRRPVGSADEDRYQTVYADRDGSVAAPTAGLHFTDTLLCKLKDCGVGIARVTLHVGAGTFLPVTADETADHKMHAEWGEVSPDVARKINDTRSAGGRVIAVGTTSLRLLESAANEDGTMAEYCDETDIFITPGYKFKCVDALITNFHLPRSTLFMLVCAFAGVDTMKAAYAYAIENEYRFYSYGDASLLER